MAWGSSKPKTPPPPPSALSKILPLLLTLIVLGAIAFIGFNVWIMATAIADRTSQKLEKKNVIFTKDGMKVGVKEVKDEALSDRSQSLLVKAWNFSTWPAYQSRLWNKEQNGQTTKKKA